MDKPYLLRPWEILQLTDRQIVEMYYRKRDEKGIPIESPQEQAEWNKRKKPMTEDEILLQKYLNFMKMGSMMGGNKAQMNSSWIKKYGKIPGTQNA